MQSKAHLDQLISPLGGLIHRVARLPGNPGEPSYMICGAYLNDLTKVLPSVRNATGGRPTTGQIDGAGGAVDPELAVTRALAEALERYSSCAYSERQFIWATARELGDDALDLHQVPRCSERELAHPKCPLTTPNEDAPIRWVKGLSLRTGRPVWIPAIMVYLHIPYLSVGERFALPISTGCAAHISYTQALVNAITEVIERDAIALTWLQRLPLPRIEIDQVPEELVPSFERYRRSHVTTQFFDATTDVGIPTIYSVDVSPHNRKLAILVMCATDLNPVRALEKVMRESGSSRIAMQSITTNRSEPDDFIGVFDGAAYMGVPERMSAFRFLLETPNRRQLSDMPVLESGNPEQDLALLLGRLETLKMEAYAVDLTTDEALQVGMRVVRVVIPQLQPLTFSFRARYLGHPRLYEAPVRMGYKTRSEAEINPWPQPFA